MKIGKESNESKEEKEKPTLEKQLLKLGRSDASVTGAVEYDFVHLVTAWPRPNIPVLVKNIIVSQIFG